METGCVDVTRLSRPYTWKSRKTTTIRFPLPSAVFANEVRDANSMHVRNHGKSSVDCSFGPKMQRDEKGLSLETL